MPEVLCCDYAVLSVVGSEVKDGLIWPPGFEICPRSQKSIYNQVQITPRTFKAHVDRCLTSEALATYK